MVQAIFVQFDKGFTGLGVEVKMLLQCTLKGICYSVSAQAWVSAFKSAATM